MDSGIVNCFVLLTCAFTRCTVSRKASGLESAEHELIGRPEVVCQIGEGSAGLKFLCEFDFRDEEPRREDICLLLDHGQ